MKDKVVNYFLEKIKSKNIELDDIKIQELRYGLSGLYTLITKSFVIILLSIIFKSINCFLALLDALNSTGRVTTWNNNIANNKINPIIAILYELNANPINTII